MNCDKVKQWISQYELGDLSPEQSALIKEHLTQCPACRRESEALNKVWQAMEVLEAEEVPGALATRLKYRLEAERKPRSTWFQWRFRPAPTLAGILILCLLATGVWFIQHPLNKQDTVAITQAESINLEAIRFGQLGTSWQLEELEEENDISPSDPLGSSSSPLMNCTEEALQEYLKEGG